MNNKVFVIGIELNNRAAYNRFENHSFYGFLPMKIMPGLYCIETSFSITSENLRSDITDLFAGYCMDCVMKSRVDASWRLPLQVDYWLKENI